MNSTTKVGIHTTFIAKENILFLAEWIAYYYALGVSKFYLYDNSKVEISGSKNIHKLIRHSGLPIGVNKRLVNYGDIITLSDQEISKTLVDISNLFPKGVVNYIEWTPMINGKIVYGQLEAFEDLRQHHFDEVDWMMNLDLDEFLISNISIQNLISNVPSNCDVINFNKFTNFDDKYKDPFNSCLEYRNCYIVREHSKLRRPPTGCQWPCKYMVRVDSVNVNRLITHQVEGENIKTVQGTSLGVHVRHYNHWQDNSVGDTSELIRYRNDLVKNSVGDTSELIGDIKPWILNRVHKRLADGVGSIEWRRQHLDVLEWSKVNGCIPSPSSNYLEDIQKLL